VSGVPPTVDAEADVTKREGHDSIDVTHLAKRLGRYELVLPLGEGGMGMVFAGRLVGPHGLERLVAIKTLRPIASSSHRGALLREARLTARLHHRNIVATLDLDELGDVPYVVMELVDGVSLSTLQKRLRRDSERLAPELAGWIAMQCALGLHAAHELVDANGRSLALVHRDVSPQNILLAMTGEVKIADFGIAKFLGRDESTATGLLQGKFGYMSPEQASSDVIDRRSDVFALGIVLWESLAGRSLFSSDHPARTLVLVREHQPEPPSSVRPGVSGALDEVTLRCLAKNPDERYASAADVAEALRAALRSGGALVDEADLSALMGRLFAAERSDFLLRVRSNAPLGGDRHVTPRDAEELAGVSGTAPTRTSRGAVRVTYRALAVAAGIGALVLGGVVTWGSHRALPSPAPPPAAASAAPVVLAPNSVAAEPVRAEATVPPASSPLAVVEEPPPARARSQPSSSRKKVTPPPSPPASAPVRSDPPGTPFPSL
jgi:hypothetical protein